MAIMNELMAKAMTEALNRATAEQWEMVKGSALHAEEAFKLFNDTVADKEVTADEMEVILAKIFASAGGITGAAVQAYFASMMKKVFG